MSDRSVYLVENILENCRFWMGLAPEGRMKTGDLWSSSCGDVVSLLQNVGSSGISGRLPLLMAQGDDASGTDYVYFLSSYDFFLKNSDEFWEEIRNFGIKDIGFYLAPEIIDWASLSPALEKFLKGLLTIVDCKNVFILMGSRDFNETLDVTLAAVKKFQADFGLEVEVYH